MFNFRKDRAEVEAEGVYVGGWSVKHLFWPQKKNGIHNSAEDRIGRSTVDVDWTKAEEKALLQKLDFRVLFPCCMVYFLAYLDRANIGNVKILRSGTDSNMTKALGLEGRQFNWAVSITYFPVLFFLIPSNFIVKVTSAKHYLPIVTFLFGGISMCIAACHNAAGLFTCRFFLGFPESGVVPACILYFSFWYKPVERAWRIGLFHASNALASGVSGFLAVGIDKLNGKGGLDSWQWVFIIEGGMAVVLSPVIYWLLLTFPENSTALSERQRHIAINRLAIGATRKTDITWDYAAVKSVILRPSTYLFFISYTSLCMIGTSQGTFTPTILHEFVGFSTQKANAYMGLVYLTLNIPMYYIWPLHSDWTRERMWHYILLVLFAIPCYATYAWVSHRQNPDPLSGITLYGLTYLGHLTSVAQPVALSFRTSTLYGASEQAVGGGIQIGALYFSSIISPQMYPDSDGPWFFPAFIATCVLLAVCILSYLALPSVLLWEAKQRKAKYGHSMPLRAMEDAARSEATTLHLERFQADKAEAKHIERV